MIYKVYRKLTDIIYSITKYLPYFNFIYYTSKSQTPISFSIWFNQKVLGYNRDAYWPCSKFSKISCPNKILAGIDTSPGYMKGCYIQGCGGIEIGDYTQIGPNVGIISSNHDVYENNKAIMEKVIIGKYCWIGMGSVILPGVVLGDFTIVGAGSIVTKSFSNGYCIIAGNPAKVVKNIDPNLCVRITNKYKYNGYISNVEYKKRFID